MYCIYKLRKSSNKKIEYKFYSLKPLTTIEKSKWFNTKASLLTKIK